MCVRLAPGSLDQFPDVGVFRIGRHRNDLRVETEKRQRREILQSQIGIRPRRHREQRAGADAQYVMGIAVFALDEIERDGAAPAGAVIDVNRLRQ